MVGRDGGVGWGSREGEGRGRGWVWIELSVCENEGGWVSEGLWRE